MISNENHEYKKQYEKLVATFGVNGFVMWTKIPSFKLTDKREKTSMGIEDYFSDNIVGDNTTGKQTQVRTAFHLIPSIALFKLAEILYEGSLKYDKDNWKKIDVDVHLSRCIQHIYAFLAKDKTEDHLAHALCRLVFAAALHYEAE